MGLIVSLLTAVASLLFALTMLDQYLERRRPYQLVWTVGLLLYFTASAVEAWRGAFGTTEVAFRLWYYTGAMLVAAYLGAGTVYLLAPRRVGHIMMGVLVAVTLIGGILAFRATLSSDVVVALTSEEPLTSKNPATGESFYPGYVVAMTVLLNIYGTLALAGGALYSAVVFALRRAMPYRVVSNVLIFLGALISAAGGALDRFGFPDPHALALLVGVVVIYLGFLRSREVFQVYRIPFRHRAQPRPTSHRP
ncbi:MAG: hypothetical protein HW388_1506 [Dehalococcoidia bacterium]|nr:hypothetical protein [Dehalococcoidia bacterium]